MPEYQQHKTYDEQDDPDGPQQWGCEHETEKHQNESKNNHGLGVPAPPEIETLRHTTMSSPQMDTRTAACSSALERTRS